MRTLFIITCIANIAFAFGTLPWMPDAMLISIIAAHLGAGVLIGSMLTETGLELSYMPNREYYLNEENRPKTIRLYRSFVESIGVGVMLLFLFIQWVIGQYFQADVPNLVETGVRNLMIGFITFFVFLIVECVRLHLAFRLPKGKDIS